MPNVLLAWKNNPVLVNELRSRMRGRRAFMILAGHLLILSGLIFIIYLTIYEETQNYSNYYYSGSLQQTLEASANLGKAIFYGSTFFLLLVGCLVGPSFTSGAIVSEKDHQTYDLLVITALSARSIVLGKLNAVLVFMGLLILATLPFQSMAYFLGGVTFAEIFIATLILILTTLLFCSWGLFVSSVSRSAAIANMVNYAVVVPMMMGVPFFSFLTAILSSGYFFDRLLNDPPYPLAALLVFGMLFFISTNPLSMAITSAIFVEETGNYFFSIEDFFNHKIPIVAPWIIYTIFCLVMSLIFIRATITRVDRVGSQ